MFFKNWYFRKIKNCMITDIMLTANSYHFVNINKISAINSAANL